MKGKKEASVIRESAIYFLLRLLSHLLLFDEEFVNDSGHPVDSRYRAGDQNSPRKDEEEKKRNAGGWMGSSSAETALRRSNIQTSRSFGVGPSVSGLSASPPLLPLLLLLRLEYHLCFSPQ